MSWDCEAYGPAGVKVGALCFIAGELGQRVCPHVVACRWAMTEQRGQVYDRILELAASGDEVGLFLADAFTGPEQLLVVPLEMCPVPAWRLALARVREAARTHGLLPPRES